MNDISIHGYESGSLECDSDDNSEVASGEGAKGIMVPSAGRKKAPREKKEKKEKKGKRGEHELCDCVDDCEFMGEEVMDKKTKKLIKKLEKEERKGKGERKTSRIDS